MSCFGELSGTKKICQVRSYDFSHSLRAWHSLLNNEKRDVTVNLIGIVLWGHLYWTFCEKGPLLLIKLFVLFISPRTDTSVRGESLIKPLRK